MTAEDNQTMPVSSGPFSDYSKTELVVQTVLLVILAVCIIFGNSLVCIAVATERKLQTVTNSFVVSLACSDLVVGILIVPLYSYITNANTASNSIVYEIWLALEIMACTTSITNLVAISVERCVSVKLPALHRNISRNVVYIVIALVWIYSIFISGALLRFYIGLPKERKPWQAVYRTIMSFVFPLIIIVIVYSMIFQVAISRSRRHQSSFSRELRISLIIAVVIGAFFCAWAPFFVLTLVSVYAQDANLRWRAAVIAVKWLQFLNSVVNPIIYTCGNLDFRKTFLKLLRCFKNHPYRGHVTRLHYSTASRSRSGSRFDSRTEQTSLRNTHV